MFQVIQESGGFSLLLKREAAPFGVALIVAELFFKFHSFTLECVAFLCTWYLFSWLVNRR